VNEPRQASADSPPLPGTVLPWTGHTHSPNATRTFAAEWIRWVEPAAIIALSGPMGSGKTCFTQGLAEGLKIDEAVTSPTFTLVHEYGDGPLLIHLDLYRVQDSQEALDFGLEEYANGPWITVVEWADRLTDWLPPSAWHITLTPGDNPHMRTITINREASL